MILNGSQYRIKINGQILSKERSFSYEPDCIQIIILGDKNDYNEWLKNKGEKVLVEVTNTDIKHELWIRHVILSVEIEEVVEIILKLYPTPKDEFFG